MSTLRLLALAGRNGPIILLGGMLVGILAPPLTDYAKPFMGLAVFMFTLGAFLKVDLPSFQSELKNPVGVMLALAWITFGVPFSAFIATSVLPVSSDLRLGLLLGLLAPPVGSAAAVAAMLGLSAPFALLVTLIATIASPFYLPPLAAALANTQLDLNATQLAVRLLIIVGGSCIAATALRRYARSFVQNNPHAMTGVAVFGLILVAIGAMKGMQDMLRVETARVLTYLLLAFVANIGFQIIGFVLFASRWRSRALTIGLVSGNRNITLIWAAIGSGLTGHPEVELYLAVSVIPIFVLPALFRLLINPSRNLVLDGAAGCHVPTPD